MTSRFQPPPIIKACERLLVEIEQAVSRFPRYHRYQIGSDLRKQAMTAWGYANKAWRDRARQTVWVEKLKWAVDDLKQYLQTAKLLHAFGSFRQFEAIARLAEQLGAQAGGWHRQLHLPKAQNAPADGIAQRGQKLSTRTAPAGANP
jgi:hypothetical protein